MVKQSSQAMNRYDPNFGLNPESEPVIGMSFKVGEQSIHLRMDYESTSVFTHPEKYAHLDHIFVSMEDQRVESEEIRTMGAFIWRQVLPDWEDLKESLVTRDFTHVRSPHPSEHDVIQYESSKLIPPSQEYVKAESGLLLPQEEPEDADVAEKMVADFDNEWYWFSEDSHFYDRIQPRKTDGAE